VALQRGDGIVLRTRPFSESDLIVDLFFADRGRRTLIAKGARGSRSTVGGVFDALNRVEVVFYEKPSLDLVSQAALLEGFTSLKSDLPGVIAALGVASMLDRMLPLHQADERAYRVFDALLRILDGRSGDSEVVCLAGQLKLLQVLGHRPRLGACAICGGDAAPFGFSEEEGGVVCSRCSTGNGEITAGLARSMERLLEMPLTRSQIVKLSPVDLATARQAVGGFVEHLARGG